MHPRLANVATVASRTGGPLRVSSLPMSCCVLMTLLAADR